MPDYSTIPVKDFAFQHITVKATCLTCNRSRVQYGGLLERNFPAETRLHESQLIAFAQRMVCSQCGARGPRLELGVWE